MAHHSVLRIRQSVERLSKATPNLIETEFLAFDKFLQSGLYFREMLNSLIARERSSLEPYIEEFAKGRPLEDNIGLMFADTLEKRAAFGYLVIQGLLGKKYANRIETANRFGDVGEKYGIPGFGGMSASDKIKQFVRVFVEPILDYLESAANLDDLVQALMVRYKTRGEWFEKYSLTKLAEKALNDEGRNKQVEQILKMDFYKFLFDQGVDFTIAPETPGDQSQVDVLTAKFPDGQRLVLEAKVYDGKNRDRDYVKSGIPQAATYANNWGEPLAYLLVYNIASESVVEFTGAKQAENVWSIISLGREVRMLVLNLAVHQSASNAKKLTTVPIDLSV